MIVIEMERFKAFLSNKYQNLKDINISFKKCSKYNNDNYLVDCEMKTISFDKLTEWYFKHQRIPKSADAMSFSNDNSICFIEFKSGDQTRPERKLQKLISGVAGKINDSDSTISSMYAEAFNNSEDRLNQKFYLVVDSKAMGINKFTYTLSKLSMKNNSSLKENEKIMYEKVMGNLKEETDFPDHFSKIDVWDSQLFEKYLELEGITDFVI